MAHGGAIRSASRSRGVKRGGARAPGKSPGRRGKERADQPIARVGGTRSWGESFPPEGRKTSQIWVQRLQPQCLRLRMLQMEPQTPLKISQDFLYQLIPWSVAFVWNKCILGEHLNNWGVVCECPRRGGCSSMTRSTLSVIVKTSLWEQTFWSSALWVFPK